VCSGLASPVCRTPSLHLPAVPKTGTSTSNQLQVVMPVAHSVILYPIYSYVKRILDILARMRASFPTFALIALTLARGADEEDSRGGTIHAGMGSRGAGVTGRLRGRGTRDRQ
jgi:hypothetical protein